MMSEFSVTGTGLVKKTLTVTMRNAQYHQRTPADMRVWSHASANAAFDITASLLTNNNYLPRY